MLKAKNLCVLKTTEEFVRGEMDNVTLNENVLCLEQLGGRYVLYGCYTAPATSFPPFVSLAMSWNAETPKGTVVEAQCRVMMNGEWTSWISFGKWSPFLERATQPPKTDAPVYVEGGILRVREGTATQAQLRIYLYTDDEKSSPSVRLLGASVRPKDEHPQPAEPYGRLIRLPAYSQNVRDPKLKQYMDSPAALASLMNRWGLDVLPEEVTLAMFDHGRGDCKNHSFAVAVAGAYGYEAFLAYLDPMQIWRAVKAGASVAVELNYTTDSHQAEELALPVLEGSTENGIHQLMPLRGFEVEPDGKVLALVNDSHATCDQEAERTYPAEKLWTVYSGLALIMTDFHKNQHNGGPQRRHASLRALEEVGSYRFQTPEGEDLPIPKEFGGCLAAVVAGGTAWATTAHKTFHYLTAGPEGSIQIPEELRQPGNKLTVYAIWPSGSGLVGQISL